MEEITIKELNIDYYKQELEATIRELHKVQEENQYLTGEIDDQNELIRSLREDIDRISHEDEVIITTKHKIRSIDLYFEEGAKR